MDIREKVYEVPAINDTVSKKEIAKMVEELKKYGEIPAPRDFEEQECQTM